MSPPRPRTASRPALAGWVLFDWASQPFFTLVSTFVFAPYFASALAANPAQGQALWGYATAAAGLALGVLSPMLGSVADAGGAKKPWIAGSSTVLALACAALWFAAPGTPGAILLALIAFAVATIAAEIAAVFNNAMMSHLVPPERLGRLSGAGWAAGYAGGLVSLILVLGLLVASPETGRTYLGFEPLIGGAPGSRTGDRATGPLSALWLLVFLLPLFVLTPDAPRSGLKLGAAVQEGLARLKGTVGEAQSQPALLRFLVANMVYQDGLVALFAFGGIYGAGVFGWGPLELGLFGIGLTVTGTLGALAGGVLDDRVGARAVILGGLAALVAVCLGILSLGREHVLFVVATAPKTAGSGPFSTAPEQAYLALGLVIGAVAGPIQAASRSFLGRLVPPSEAGRYFGLLALSGKVTSFLAPLAVALATSATGRQEAGLAVLVAFFALGALLLAGVAPRPGFAREAG